MPWRCRYSAPAAPGTAGSGLNSLSTVASIAGASGAVLLQNAVDSIESRVEKDNENKTQLRRGEIDIVIGIYGNDEIVLAVIDNGFPDNVPA